MKKILFLFIASLLLQSCDDGDIIVTTFNFDDAELKNCGGVGNYVFYKVNPDALESLSLRLGTMDSIYKPSGTRVFTLNGTSNFVNYRTYDGALGTSYFCSSIPPTSPNVTVDYIAASGTVDFVVTFVYDDFDGLPTDSEESGDTDGDGLPNIYDLDDDGDNVPTVRELDNGVPRDSDGDGVPDHLDTDDDNDGVLTRDEDKDGDLDPTNDVTDSSVGPDYLNDAVANNYDINRYRVHTYKIYKSVNITLKNLVLVKGEEEITQETINMGGIENVEIKDKTIRPEFLP